MLEIGKPHTETIVQGAYLIYRRPANGAAGVWFARGYDSVTGRMLPQHRLGSADDFLEADGSIILTYKQAHDAVGRWLDGCTRRAQEMADGAVVPKGPYTVGAAMAAYLLHAQKELKGYLPLKQMVDANILPYLGNIEVARLTRKRIEDWLEALANSPRRRTGKKRGADEKVEYLPAPITEDQKRRRKCTANRNLANLKSALNMAVEDGRLPRDHTPWREVKPYRNVASTRVRWLSIQEQVHLVNACPPDFRQLVEAALFTGARYGELTRLRVKDFNPGTGTVFIEFSKSGKPRHIVLTEEALAWFTTLTLDRASDELMLQRKGVNRTKRTDMENPLAWAASDQAYYLKQACEAAGLKALTFHELRHTYASTLLNAGVPASIIAAQLGHTDTRMVEKHYGHLCPNAVSATIRRQAPMLGIGQGSVPPGGNVMPLAVGRKKRA